MKIQRYISSSDLIGNSAQSGYILSNGKFKATRLPLGLNIREVDKNGCKIGVWWTKNADEIYSLEILPKGTDFSKLTTELEYNQTWATIFLQISKVIDSKTLELSLGLDINISKKTSASKLLDLLLLESFSEIYDSLKEPHPKKYKRKEEYSSRIRGKIKWSKQISKMIGLKSKHAISYASYTDEIWHYGFIKLGLDYIEKKLILRTPEIANLLNACRKELHIISPKYKNILDYKELVQVFLKKPEGKGEFLENSVREIAKWVFQWGSENLNTVSCNLNSFTLNVEDVFEQWCRNTVSEVTENFICSKKSDERWLWGEPPLTLKPDISILSAKGDDLIVKSILDAKYKPKKSWFRSDDIAQLITYKYSAEVGTLRDSARSKKILPTADTSLCLLYPSDEKRAQKFTAGDNCQIKINAFSLPFSSYLMDDLNSDDWKLDFKKLLYEEMNISEMSISST